MKKTLIIGSMVAAAALVAYAQPTLDGVKGYTTARPIQGITNQVMVNFTQSAGSLPVWTYSVTAYDSNVYTGTIMGRNPSLRAKSITTIPLQIVPVSITITDAGHGAQTYDPTVADTCFTLSDSTHPTDLALVSNSPMFQNNLYDGGVGAGHAPKINGIDVTQGVATQYVDAYVRANWWTLVQNTNYHLLFSVTVLPTQTMSFNSTTGQNYFSGVDFSGGCGKIGVVDIDAFDTATQALITGPLSATIQTNTFPMFITGGVVMGAPGHDLFSNCCVLGFHSGFLRGGTLQVYSPFAVNANFGDISTLSHEVTEAVFDPTGVNPTPVWGNEGQVVGQCQNNFEVGDPLSPGFGTPTVPYTITQNKFTYTLQELAFFNWFFGGTNSGAGGFYSSHGTFAGHAKLCPPGGTN